MISLWCVKLEGRKKKGQVSQGEQGVLQLLKVKVILGEVSLSQ